MNIFKWCLMIVLISSVIVASSELKKKVVPIEEIERVYNRSENNVERGWAMLFFAQYHIDREEYKHAYEIYKSVLQLDEEDDDIVKRTAQLKIKQVEDALSEHRDKRMRYSDDIDNEEFTTLFQMLLHT